jgi:predicted dehydrogenase
VVAVADPHAGAGSHAERILHFADVEALLDATPVDALFLALPPPIQGEVALRVLKRGFAVFIEKPMAMDSDRAKEIERIAREKSIVVGVGHVVRYDPAFEYVEELVRDGVIGRILSAACERRGARARPDVSPWWVLGPHELTRLMALFPGVPQISEVRMGAQEACVSLSLGEVSCNVIVSSGELRRRVMVLKGERGTITFDESAGAVAVETPLGREVRSFSGDALRSELEGFLAGLREGRPMRTDARDGLQVVLALESAERFGNSTVRIEPSATSTKRSPSTENASEYSRS